MTNSQTIVLADVARVMQDNGLQPLPCRRDKKHPSLPSWSRYQSPEKRLPTDQFPPGGGVGLVCGKASGGLEVIDIDDPSCLEPMLEQIRKQRPNLEPQLQLIESPSGGYHLRYRSLSIGNNQTLAWDINGKKRVETRGEGGFIMSPPTSGYTRLKGPEWPQMIDKADRQFLLELGRSFNHRAVERLEKPVPEDLPDNDHFEGTSPNIEAINWAERCRNYIEKMPAAISGQGGHNQTFLVAQHILGFMDDDTATATQILREYNQRCEPPWTESDLVHKLSEARKNGETVRPGEHRILETARATTAPSRDLSWLFDHNQRTDIAQGRRFAELFEAKAKWVEAWQSWIVWDGVVWRQDQSEQVVKLAEQMHDDMWRQYLHHAKETGADDTNLKQVHKWLSNETKRRQLKTVVDQARKHLAINHQDLDKHPHLLTVRNGIIDLRTSELRASDSALLLTKFVDMDFDPQANAPQFERFVKSLWTDPQLPRFIQRFLGYGITGHTREHKVAFFAGSGANGKTTLCGAVCSALGTDMADTIPSRVLVKSGRDEHLTLIANLYGKRLAFASETEDGGKLNEEQIKSLSGGDRISARRMREDLWTFSPTHQLILSTNHPPQIRGTDEGLWRRLLLVKFDRSFRGRDCDQHLPDKLAKEAQGILTWLVEGAREWFSRGLDVPRSVETATSEYRSEQDVVGSFIRERLTFEPNKRLSNSQLQYSFQSYLLDELGQDSSLPMRRLRALLKGHPESKGRIRDFRTNSERGLEGICIQPVTVVTK